MQSFCSDRELEMISISRLFHLMSRMSSHLNCISRIYSFAQSRCPDAFLTHCVLLISFCSLFLFSYNVKVKGVVVFLSTVKLIQINFCIDVLMIIVLPHSKAHFSINESFCLKTSLWFIWKIHTILTFRQIVSYSVQYPPLRPKTYLTDMQSAQM